MYLTVSLPTDPHDMHMYPHRWPVCYRILLNYLVCTYETTMVSSYTICNISATPGLVVVTSCSSLGSYTTLYTSLFYALLSSLVCTWRDFPVGHTSWNCSRPSTLNSGFLCSWASKKGGILWWYEYSFNPITPWAKMSLGWIGKT
jgi:hypothetical protein